MRELWLCRNTIIEMVKSRGYSTTQQILTLEEFMAQFPSAQTNPGCLNFTVSKPESGDFLALHFTNDEKLSKASFDKIIQDYISQSIPSLVLITVAKLNPSCKALMKASKLNIEHFLIEELQFNVTKHCLVPPHRILIQGQSEELLKKLRTDQGSLPTILTSDVVCRYIGGKVGDIIEIERDSLTTGKSLYYRTVRDM